MAQDNPAWQYVGVGSLVWFYSQPGSKHERDNPPPSAAFVAGRGMEDGTFNLHVIETGGTATNRSDVLYVEAGTEPPEDRAYCVWPQGAGPAPTEPSA